MVYQINHTKQLVQVSDCDCQQMLGQQDDFQNINGWIRKRRKKQERSETTLAMMEPCAAFERFSAENKREAKT